MNGVYVALGSSMAAGPGIRPRAPGSPRRAGRSTRNYAGLVSQALDVDLIDVTYSGATTAHLLGDRQHGAPPQVEALDGPGARTVLVPAAAASRGHHAWSAEPWTVGARFPWPGRPAPLHPNAAGMRAVADLVVEAVRPGR